MGLTDLLSSASRLPTVCPKLADWLIVGLTGIGGVLGLVASVQTIRLKDPTSAAFQGGVPELQEALRRTGRVLLFGSVVVLFGVGAQVVMLTRRC